MDSTRILTCEYRLLDSGVHEFIWHSNSYEAVDTYMAQLARIYERADPNRLIYWLHRDAGTGLPSVSYFLQKVRDLEHRFPDRPPTRAAILYGSGIRLMILNGLVTLTNIRGKDTTRFFPLTLEADALAWLMNAR